MTEESPFAGTARYYARYRVPYPQRLIKDLAAHFSLDGKGRLLDLGCGPGTLTFPLSPYFESIVALDIEPSMIEEARQIQQSFDDLRRRHIDWHVIRAEDISADLGTFQLVTCGSSFHWMDRDLVLAKIRELLEPGCGVALAGGGASWLDEAEDWHKIVARLIREYLGETRRGNAHSDPNERFEQALARNGWLVEMTRDYSVIQQWDIDSILGHLWSTSFANRARLGDRSDEFETELRQELLRLRPEGLFRETGVFGLVSGRLPSV